MSADLIAFLESRLAEDEVIAGLAAEHDSSELTTCDDSEALHIYAGRLLRECDAKRQLIARISEPN